jgi:hypothetical protein
MMAVSSATMITSCTVEDNPSSEPVVEPESQVPAARITETIRKEEAKATVYNFEYPSVDPYGNPVTLSGSIVVGDEVETDGKQASGMVLYNHFTVFQKDECPSRGDLGIVLKVVGSKLIAVAPDYYGFGVTGDKNQAYCMSRTNAQSSVDALLAARQLLKEKGYKWGDFLFNLGYSEGGQTAMGVVRLVAEKYPDIKITHTVAGAGPYDIGETYRQLVSSGETSMPSTVISTLLAYNEYNELDVDNNEMFLDPILDNILIYLLSKDYKRDDLEGKLASYKIADWINPILFDFNSDLSLKFMEVFEKDNLSKGWKPRGDERISLVHNTLDACVPYANTTQMAEFFKQAGFTVDEGRTEDRYVDGKVFVYSVNVPALSEKTGTHEAGAIAFVAELVIVVCHYLDIKPWFSLTAEELEGV